MQETIQESIKKSCEQLLECSWVKSELINSDFGDTRLEKRFLAIAHRLAKQPSANICNCDDDWGLVKSAYRFFDNPKVTQERILSSHWRRTGNRIRSQKGNKVLILQDTTSLNYSNLKTATDLGHIGKNKHAQGLMLHQSLAVTETGVPLGGVDQQIWSREEYRRMSNKNNIARLDVGEKESFRWLKAINKYKVRASDCITVCDREAHFYEFFHEAAKLQVEALVRARRGNFIGSKEYKMKLSDRKVAKSYSIEVPNTEKTKLRTAEVDLRYGKLVIQFPDRLQKNTNYSDKADLDMHFIGLTEQDPPPGEKPIEWLLLTNTAITSIKQAKQAIAWYKTRWQIEIFFKILKSGCKIEDSLLRKNFRREPYIALQSITAWRLLLMTNFQRANPKASATSILSQQECDSLVSASSHKIVKNTDINVNVATKLMAGLGGYKESRSIQPGPKAIWKGWERLQDFALMYNIAMNSP